MRHHPAPGRLFWWLVGFLFLALLHGPAAAAQCSDVYPGAQMGPPPEWAFWGDGSACFVRWVSDSPQHEERLLARCRETVGARFVHFEPDKGVGHNICIFKIVGVAAPSEGSGPPDAAQLPVNSNQQSVTQSLQQDQKIDTQNALSQLEAVVRTWNADCLNKERAKDAAAAGFCWKTAAQAVDQFAGAAWFPTELESGLEQLRTTWMKRAEQLTGPAIVNDVIAIQPAATYPDGPDPDRLAATTACSSTNLGDYKSCIGPPISSGNDQFEFSLKPTCATGSIAAISTIDAKGRCVRQVVSLRPDTRSAIVESHGNPAVLDAVAFRQGIIECYARRHQNISCSGKIDYSDPQSLPKQAATKKRLAKQASEQKRRKIKVISKPSSPKQAQGKKPQPKKEAALKVSEKETPVRNTSGEQPVNDTRQRKGITKSVKCFLLKKSCPQTAN